jgi:predicted PhzF superfamily epimerase YddE/YHI9
LQSLQPKARNGLYVGTIQLQRIALADTLPPQLPITTGMIIVTQMNPHASSERLHINSRVFGPGVGIDEDPVVSVGM